MASDLRFENETGASLAHLVAANRGCDYVLLRILRKAVLSIEWHPQHSISTPKGSNSIYRSLQECVSHFWTL